MDYLCKGEVLTNTDLDRFENNIIKIGLFVYIEKVSSTHKKWGQKQKCCIYNFGQYIYREGVVERINERQLHHTPVSSPTEVLRKDARSENQITEGASDISRAGVLIFYPTCQIFLPRLTAHARINIASFFSNWTTI